MARDFAVRAGVGALRSLRVEDVAVSGFRFVLLLVSCAQRCDGAEGAGGGLEGSGSGLNLSGALDQAADWGDAVEHGGL